MIIIKGFCTRRLQANNELNKVATFGELSTYARTFTKDIGLYSLAITPELELNVFSHKKDGEYNGVLSTAFVEPIIRLSNWIYTKSLTVSSSVTKNDYLTEFLNNFYGEITNPNIGTIQNADGRTMPEWLSFNLVSAQENQIKIWFSSDAFERDYDEYEISVVSPLLNVDTLFRPVSEIRSALAATTIADQLDKVQAAKNKSPETVLRAETIQYINPQDSTITIDTNWYILVYGPAGNNTDAIKQAIISYILANSNEPESSWKQILPYLFKTTRMYILPQWTHYAIANRETYAGIYSPITTVKDGITSAKAALSHLASTFVEENLQFTHHKYRSISLLCCGGDDNAQSKFKLTDYVPDYIGESSNTQDFNRMSELSKQWTVMMEELLIMAENNDEYTSLPLTTRRINVNNVLYLSRRLGNVEYLVAVREVV